MKSFKSKLIWLVKLTFWVRTVKNPKPVFLDTLSTHPATPSAYPRPDSLTPSKPLPPRPSPRTVPRPTAAAARFRRGEAGFRPPDGGSRPESLGFRSLAAGLRCHSSRAGNRHYRAENRVFTAEIRVLQGGNPSPAGQKGKEVSAFFVVDVCCCRSMV